MTSENAPLRVKSGRGLRVYIPAEGLQSLCHGNIQSILDRHQKLEEQEISTLNSSSSRIYAKKLINCIAVLDALMSLAHYSYFSIEGVFPQILPEGKRAFKYVEGVHPILQQIASDAYIPNELDMSDEPVMVLTGANMGGKSSLMRQSALLAVLAQIGVKVPAESMALSPIDRIFTRIGASDNIFGGESTFLVELSEMSRILSGMTEASFVLIDELGRERRPMTGCLWHSLRLSISRALGMGASCSPRTTTESWPGLGYSYLSH
ncbi:MutS -like protein 6, partial [Caligus rogercresseyi]